MDGVAENLVNVNLAECEFFNSNALICLIN